MCPQLVSVGSAIFVSVALVDGMAVTPLTLVPPHSHAHYPLVTRFVIRFLVTQSPSRKTLLPFVVFVVFVVVVVDIVVVVVLVVVVVVLVVEVVVIAFTHGRANVPIVGFAHLLPAE